MPSDILEELRARYTSDLSRHGEKGRRYLLSRDEFEEVLYHISSCKDFLKCMKRTRLMSTTLLWFLKHYNEICSLMNPKRSTPNQDPSLEDAYRVYTSILSKLPLKREYDQLRCSPESNIWLVQKIQNDMNPKNKTIAFFGDDDFASIFIGMALRPKKIYVFDIDRRILNSINNIATKYDINIETREIDLTKKLPEKYRSKFDLIIMDPPYTKLGIETFIEKGVFCLSRKRTSKIYLFLYPMWVKDEYQTIQEKILNLGLIFDEIIKSAKAYVVTKTDLKAMLPSPTDQLLEEILLKLSIFYSDLLVLKWNKEPKVKYSALNEHIDENICEGAGNGSSQGR